MSKGAGKAGTSGGTRPKIKSPIPSATGPDKSSKFTSSSQDEMKSIIEKVKEIQKENGEVGREIKTSDHVLEELGKIQTEMGNLRSLVAELKNILKQNIEIPSLPKEQASKNKARTQVAKRPPQNLKPTGGARGGTKGNSNSEDVTERNTMDIVQEINLLFDKLRKLEGHIRIIKKTIIQNRETPNEDHTTEKDKKSKTVSEKEKDRMEKNRNANGNTYDSESSEAILNDIEIYIRDKKAELATAMEQVTHKLNEAEALKQKTEKFEEQINECIGMVKESREDIYLNGLKLIKGDATLFENVYPEVIKEAKRCLSNQKDIENVKDIKLKEEKCLVSFIEFAKVQTEEEPKGKTKETITEDFQDMLQSLKNNLESKTTQLRKEINDVKKKLYEKESECDSLQLRLSKIAGAKLTDGNPNITNLGDPNRPMKIGEKFSELYDNEWTDLLDNFVKKKKYTEDMVTLNIFYCFQCCYKTCKIKASKQLEFLKLHAKKSAAAILSVDEKHSEVEKIIDQFGIDNRYLLELRRQLADKTAQLILKDITKDPDFIKQMKEYKANKDITEQIFSTDFFQKGVNICWKMVIQEPPMYLHPGIPKGNKYDRTFYREYTSSGQKVVFTVWPALFLNEGGALLHKGVVKVT